MRRLIALTLLFVLITPCFADGIYVRRKRQVRRPATAKRKVIKRSGESPEVYVEERPKELIGIEPPPPIDITQHAVELPFVVGRVELTPELPPPTLPADNFRFTEFDAPAVPWWVWTAGGSVAAAGAVLALRDSKQQGRSVPGSPGEDVRPIPEPESLVLLAIALCAAWFEVRRSASR